MKSESQIIINPKMYPKYKGHFIFMIIFGIFWIPSTVFVTHLALTKQETPSFIWLIFGYFGTIFIFWSLFSRNRIITVKLSKEQIQIQGTKLRATGIISFSKGELQELTLELLQLACT